MAEQVQETEQTFGPAMEVDDKGNLFVKEKDGEKGYLIIPVTKAKATVEVCIDDLPTDVYKEVMIQGLKHFMNQGMGDIKVTGLKDKDLVTAQKLALDVAEENTEKLYSGKIRMSKGTRTKIAGAVKVEAMRLARLVVKQAIKDDGGKVSHYSAKQISEAAQLWLESTEEGADCLKEAEANIKKRDETQAKAKIDLSGIKPDEELVKKAEAKAEAAKKEKEAKATRKAPVPGKKKPEQHANA